MKDIERVHKELKKAGVKGLTSDEFLLEAGIANFTTYCSQLREKGVEMIGTQETGKRGAPVVRWALV